MSRSRAWIESVRGLSRGGMPSRCAPPVPSTHTWQAMVGRLPGYASVCRESLTLTVLLAAAGLSSPPPSHLSRAAPPPRLPGCSLP